MPAPSEAPAATAIAALPRSSSASGSACASGRDWVERFIQEARDERRLGASTIAAYAMDLVMACRWATDQKMDLVGLTTADLMRYINERASGSALPSTIARHLSSCRGFYAFLVRHRVITVNPAAAVVLPRTMRHLPTPLGADLMDSLLQPPVQGGSGVAAWRSRRDHAIVCMLYGTSLGVSEVRLLRWQQIDAHRLVVLVPADDAARRSRALDTTLLSVLTSLRAAACRAGFDWVETPYCFPTASGLPMTRQALCHAVHKWGAEHGQDLSVTPSVLRRAGRARLSGRHLPRPAAAGG